MKFEIFLTPRAKVMLQNIPDRRIQAKIKERIEGLTTDPELQGKPLTEDLIGYRSLRAVGQRYRIIYKVEKKKIIVVVVAVGIRKEKSKEDIYQLAKKLIRLRLL